MGVWQRLTFYERFSVNTFETFTTTEMRDVQGEGPEVHTPTVLPPPKGGNTRDSDCPVDVGDHSDLLNVRPCECLGDKSGESPVATFLLCVVVVILAAGLIIGGLLF